MKVYALRDIVADALLPNLMLFAHDAPAIRTFGDILQNKRSDIGQHPADFDLVSLGTFDEQSGIGGFVAPHLVLTGKQWLAAQPQAES